MQEACSALAGLPQPSKPGKNSIVPVVIALGLPVLSSLTKYDGEVTVDMRMVQEREEFVRDASQLPMFKVPSLPGTIDYCAPLSEINRPSPTSSLRPLSLAGLLPVADSQHSPRAGQLPL